VLEGLGERFSSASKLRNDYESFDLLRKLGRRAARRFLDAHYDDIGVRSSIDLKAEVYAERG
jgi:NTE family protein